MNHKVILIIITQLSLFSCGFSSEETETSFSDVKPQLNGDTNGQSSEFDKEGDYDGDLISNQREIDLGRNPMVADIPSLEFKFMKDFNLKSGESSLIDSQRDIIGKKYQYRVGDYLIKEIAARATTRFARFGGVVEGHFEPVDLTRIRYPKFSKSFLLEGNTQALRASPDTSVSFKNTISLKRNRGFQKISNLIFNFHYFNHETGLYDLVGQKVFENDVFEGVLERFDVNLDIQNSEQLIANFSKRGEFITTEIEDYEIDDLKTNYKSLMDLMKQTKPLKRSPQSKLTLENYILPSKKI